MIKGGVGSPSAQSLNSYYTENWIDWFQQQEIFPELEFEISDFWQNLPRSQLPVELRKFYGNLWFKCSIVYLEDQAAVGGENWKAERELRVFIRNSCRRGETVTYYKTFTIILASSEDKQFFSKQEITVSNSDEIGPIFVETCGDLLRNCIIQDAFVRTASKLKLRLEKQSAGRVIFFKKYTKSEDVQHLLLNNVISSRGGEPSSPTDKGETIPTQGETQDPQGPPLPSMRPSTETSVVDDDDLSQSVFAQTQSQRAVGPRASLRGRPAGADAIIVSDRDHPAQSNVLVADKSTQVIISIHIHVSWCLPCMCTYLLPMYIL